MSRAERLKELAAAKRRIVRADPAFAEPIKRLAPCTFGLQKSGQTNYQSLVRAVIAQQVSVAAAKTIYRRLHEKCAGSITPPRVAALSLSQLPISEYPEVVPPTVVVRPPQPSQRDATRGLHAMLAEGAFAVLDRPFPVESLLETLRRILQRHYAGTWPTGHAS